MRSKVIENMATNQDVRMRLFSSRPSIHVATMEHLQNHTFRTTIFSNNM